MAIVWVKRGKVGYLKILGNTQIEQIDCATDPAIYTNVVPTAEELRYLPKTFLLNTAQLMANHINRSWTCLQLAEFISGHWTMISAYFAHRTGCLTVFDTENEMILNLENSSDDASRHTVVPSDVISSASDPEDAEGEIERMPLPDGVLRQFWDVCTIDGKALNAPVGVKGSMVFVKIPTIHKLVSCIYYLDGGMCGANLFALLNEISHGNINQDNILLRVQGSASQIYPYEAILNYCERGGSLIVHVRQRGGVLGSKFVKKPYVRTEDQLTSLIKRTKSNVERRFSELEDVEDAVPASLIPFLQPIEERLSIFRRRLLDDPSSMKKAVEMLDDDTIKQLVEMMEQTKGANTEERLFRASSLMSRDIKLLDVATPHLHNLRHKLMLLVVEGFVRQYHTPKNGELICRPEMFEIHLNQILNYRQGLRQSQEISSEEVPADDGNSCVVC